MTGLVLNVTELVLNMTEIVLNMTRFDFFFNHMGPAQIALLVYFFLKSKYFQHVLVTIFLLYDDYSSRHISFYVHGLNKHYDGKITLIPILIFHITLIGWKTPAPTCLAEVLRLI